MEFASDNNAGASAKILAAIGASNGGAAAAYGADGFSRAAEAAVAEVFEHECKVFLLAVGTAANALALGSLTPPWGAIFCHQEAHIYEDECGAPEFFSGGAKLVGVAGRAGKIDPDALRQSLMRFPRGIAKSVQPAALSLSQVTEAGTVYSRAEIAALAEIAHGAGLGVHMDGARFANAVVTLGCTPAEMSWKAGVDILCLGATKNGALACEAVIFFDKEKAADFEYRRKRGGHTLSKGRLLGVQMQAYLDGGHWLELAADANRSAQRLHKGLLAIEGVRSPWPMQANEVFLIIPKRLHAALLSAGGHYYERDPQALTEAERPRESELFVRLVTSYATTEAEVDAFVEVARKAASA